MPSDHHKGCCDRCGFIYALDRLHKEWTGLYVCPSCYDSRHPQEFVRAVRPDRLSYARKAVGELVTVGPGDVMADDL